ncbi:hypothetical protein [Sediminicoccus rosea]|uniref:Uncharacterized protein n=1 Tax=Sediminicoccus rosea TaxID=1225128 RepID=A0ABZ0PC38_9PROT|nr:hypothetical protein [Sediminicoccus rosea]WPB83265.1 hypothetical protein R9Z33_14235 [Sediminicoccus rosea]
MTTERLYSVHDAATEQLVWSIRAFHAASWAASISLASAAEGILRGEASSARYDIFKSLIETRGDEDARRSKPNDAIQWLRHAGPRGAAKEWGPDDAALWITGAITQMMEAFPDQPLPPAAREFWLEQDVRLRSGPGNGCSR